MKTSPFKVACYHKAENRRQRVRMWKFLYDSVNMWVRREKDFHLRFQKLYIAMKKWMTDYGLPAIFRPYRGESHERDSTGQSTLWVRIDIEKLTEFSLFFFLGKYALVWIKIKNRIIIFLISSVFYAALLLYEEKVLLLEVRMFLHWVRSSPRPPLTLPYILLFLSFSKNYENLQPKFNRDIYIYIFQWPSPFRHSATSLLPVPV